MRTLLTLIRGDRESEPVIVDTDSAGVVVLELDTGERLELDAVELAAAIALADGRGLSRLPSRRDAA